MADRALLHRSKLDLFKVWLQSKGWTIVEPKGTWEVLRAVKRGKQPLIIFTKNNSDSEHLTVQRGGIGTVREFIKELKVVP